MKCQTLNYYRVFIFTVVVCAFLQGEALADFTLTPKIDLQVEYNDNLFLTDDDEVSDFLTIIAPSVSLSMKHKHLETELNYGLEFRKYLDETYLDRDEIGDIHRGDINGSMLPNSRFSIFYKGSIERISADDRRPDIEENDIVNVTTRYHGLLRPRYQFRLTPKVTGELAYQYETSQYDDDNNRDFLDNDSDDTVDQEIPFLLKMRSSEKLDLLLDGKYAWHDSDKFGDYDMWYGLAGFIWRPKEHLSLEARAGGAITEVDNRDGDLKDSLYNVLLRYAPPQKTGYFVSYIKDFTTSINDGRYTWWETSGGITYEGRFSAEARLFARKNTYQFVERKDEFYGGDIDLAYALSSKLSAGLNTSYSYREYTPVKETADRYTFNCSLTYTMKRSLLTLRYILNINDSDISSNDYANNIVSLLFSMKL